MFCYDFARLFLSCAVLFTLILKDSGLIASLFSYFSTIQMEAANLKVSVPIIHVIENVNLTVLCVFLSMFTDQRMTTAMTDLA